MLNEVWAGVGRAAAQGSICSLEATSKRRALSDATGALLAWGNDGEVSRLPGKTLGLPGSNFVDDLATASLKGWALIRRDMMPTMKRPGCNKGKKGLESDSTASSPAAKVFALHCCKKQPCRIFNGALTTISDEGQPTFWR
jgi:hypothetical protein